MGDEDRLRVGVVVCVGDTDRRGDEGLAKTAGTVGDGRGDFGAGDGDRDAEAGRCQSDAACGDEAGVRLTWPIIGKVTVACPSCGGFAPRGLVTLVHDVGDTNADGPSQFMAFFGGDVIPPCCNSTKGGTPLGERGRVCCKGSPMGDDTADAAATLGADTATAARGTNGVRSDGTTLSVAVNVSLSQGEEGPLATRREGKGGRSAASGGKVARSDGTTRSLAVKPSLPPGDDGGTSSRFCTDLPPLPPIA